MSVNYADPRAILLALADQYRKHNDPGVSDLYNDQPFPIHMPLGMLRYAQAALDELDASKARIAEVRPLEWRPHEVYKRDAVAEAPTGGRYYASENGVWSRSHRRSGFVVGTTLDEAKAAAQADYTARILSALAPPPHGDAK
jgi:hypothetical protein